MNQNTFLEHLKKKEYSKVEAYRVENAVILAAGFASRFAPLSYTTPKALLHVRGEILIERQISQLLAAGIPEIYIVTGYQQEKFQYLAEKYPVRLIYNPEYKTRNNHSSVYAAREVLGNSYICSADNYFTKNVFEPYLYRASYSALYADGPTEEYCLTTDADDRITDVVIGGHDSWYMLGHVYFDREFSRRFLSILEREYDLPETKDLLWEKIYMKHISELPMYIRRYPAGVIHEFDTLDDLCRFDPSWNAYRDSLQETFP